MKAPEGFAIVPKMGNKPMPIARVGRASITLNLAARQVLPGFVVVALNGTSFALASGTEGDYKVSPNGQVTVTKACRTLAQGDYIGEQKDDWWIFSPVER